MATSKLVIGLAGMAGSGKSLVVNVAQNNGYSVVTMGDEVREEARRRGLDPTPENLGRVMLDLRQKEGDAVIAKRCVQKIESAAMPKAVADGIRSLAEAEEFKKHFRNFSLVAIHSSPETRFRRIYNRQRSDDPKNWTVFQERDLRELGVGLGNTIAMAEHVIVNETDYESVKIKAKGILKRIEAKWTK